MDIGGGPTYSSRKEEKTHIRKKQNSWWRRDEKLFGNEVKQGLTILKRKPRNQKSLSHFLTAT